MLSGLDLLGWVGGGLGAVAYVLVSTRRVVPDAGLFQGLNMVGAALLGVAAFHSGAMPNAFMNIIWILFGAQSLAMTSRRRRRVDLVAVATPPAKGLPAPASQGGEVGAGAVAFLG